MKISTKLEIPMADNIDTPRLRTVSSSTLEEKAETIRMLRETLRARDDGLDYERRRYVSAEIKH